MDYVSVSSTNRCTTCKKVRIDMNGKKARKIRRQFARKVAGSGLKPDELIRLPNGQIVNKKRWLYQKTKAQLK